MPCGCCGGPLARTWTNATSAKYSPTGYLSWWTDSGVVGTTNRGMYINPFYYELTGNIGNSNFFLTRIDAGSGFRMLSVDLDDEFSIGGVGALPWAVFDRNGFIYTVSKRTGSSTAGRWLVSKHNKTSLSTLWTLDFDSGVFPAYGGEHIPLVTGDVVILPYGTGSAASAQQFKKFTSGTLDVTIDRDDPGTNREILHFCHDPTNDGKYIAVGRRTSGSPNECLWLYDSSMSKVATYEPSVTMEAYPFATIPISGSTNLWCGGVVSGGNNNIVLLDSDLNEQFAPQSFTTLAAAHAFSKSDGSMIYIFGPQGIKQCTSSGTVSDLVSGIGGAGLVYGLYDETLDRTVHLESPSTHQIKQYDVSSAPGSLDWTIDPTITPTNNLKEPYNISLDLSGNIYITPGSRTASASLDRTPA